MDNLDNHTTGNNFVPSPFGDLLRERKSAEPSKDGLNPQEREALQRINEVNEVLDVIYGLTSAPPKVARFVIAGSKESQQHGNVTTNLEIYDPDLGEHLPGTEGEATNETRAKRAQRSRKDLKEWQEGAKDKKSGAYTKLPSGWKFVTWDVGGGETADGSHVPYRYDFPILRVAAKILARAPKGNYKRKEKLRQIALEYLPELRSDEPTARLRTDVRYPYESDTPGKSFQRAKSRNFALALTYIRKTLEGSSNPTETWELLLEELFLDLQGLNVFDAEKSNPEEQPTKDSTFIPRADRRRPKPVHPSSYPLSGHVSSGGGGQLVHPLSNNDAHLEDKEGREKEKGGGESPPLPAYQSPLVESPSNTGSLESGKRLIKVSQTTQTLSFSRSSVFSSSLSKEPGPSLSDRIENLAESLETNAFGFTHCPCHEDRTPSLHISNGSRATVMFCHSCGRNGAEIVNFVEGDGYHPPMHPDNAIRRDSEPKTDLPSIVAEYVYRTSEGAPVFKVLRLADKSGFPVMHFDGKWRKGLTPSNGSKIGRFLYGLDRLQGFPDEEPIYLVEGEKSADLLDSMGYLALAIGGANAWRESFAEPLRGRDIIVLPDNDRAGFQVSCAASDDLESLGCRVTWVDLDGLDEHEDVYDWIVKHRHSDTDLRIAAGECCRSCGRNLEDCCCEDAFTADLVGASSFSPEPALGSHLS